MHHLFYGLDCELLQPYDVDFLFVVFSAVHEFPIVEQIEELATVNFIEGDVELEFRVVLEESDYIVCCEEVESWDRAVRGTHHSESFA